MSSTAKNRIYALAKTHQVLILHRTTLMLLALPIAPTMADTNQRYLEANGYVHFEAEDAQSVGAWSQQSELNGYTGTGYLEWTGSNYFSKNDAGSGTTVYHFRIETAGNYEFRWRTRIAKGDSNTESNDSWVRFSTGSNIADEEALYGWSKVYMGEFGVWSWSARTVDEHASLVRQYFSQGDHTVEISGRSNGHAIDRMALYRYADVSFDPGLTGTLPLSRYEQQNGTVVDPNPIVMPEPETEPNPEPEPEPEPIVFELVNATAITADTNQSTTASCLDNTLTLPAVKSATLNTLDQPISYDTDELILQADSKSVLLSYDLSPLPVFSAAELHYFIGGENSNSLLKLYLGSHSDWPDNGPENAPNPQVKIAEAQGGWNTGTQYKSTLDASLLTLDETTLMLTMATGGEALELKNSIDPVAFPQLVITGNDSFCSDWEANVVENGAGQPTAPGNPEAGPENPTPPENQEAPETETTKKKSGGSSHWFALILLAGLYRKYKKTSV